MPYGDKPYGLRDVQITPSGGSLTNLPVARTLSFTATFSSDTLRGDDSVAAVVSFVDHLEWSIESGGIPLDALAGMVGNAVATTGTSPNEVETLTLSAGDNLPYFQIEGRSLGDTTDDAHVVIFKAKITSLEGSFGDQEFFITTCSGIAIDDGTNGIIDIIRNETAAAIS